MRMEKRESGGRCVCPQWRARCLHDRSRDAATETASIIANDGGTAIAYTADVTNSCEIFAAVNACLGRFGTIDIVHNSVNIVRSGGPIELDEADWDPICDVNLKSFFIVSKHVVPVMPGQRRGVMIHIPSFASIRTPKDISLALHSALRLVQLR